MLKMVNGKRAQGTMDLPFGLIFSIILIVVFIVIAIIAVNYFLGLKDTAAIGIFYEDLQKKVDDAWGSQSSNTEFKISLPSGLKKVCFANMSAEITNDLEYQEITGAYSEENNVFLLPPSQAENLGSKEIKHIDITKITAVKNPYCVSSSATLSVKKDFYDKLVTLA